MNDDTEDRTEPEAVWELVGGRMMHVVNVPGPEGMLR